MMRKSYIMILAFLFSCLTYAGEEAVIECNFTPQEMSDWALGTTTKIEQVNGRNTLKIIADPEKKYNLATRQINLSPFSGKTIRMYCRMKQQDVSKPLHKWNGTKFMISYTIADGPKRYLHPRGVTGDKDWHIVEYFTTIDKNPTQGKLSLGLQESSGTVWFDNIRIEVAEYPSAKFVAEGYKQEYTKHILKAPRRRGMMSPSAFTQTTLNKDLPDLKSWNANLIRWQLIRNWNKVNADGNTDEYLKWVDERIPEIKKVLDKAQALGMKVVVDLHVAPGGRNINGEINMFSNRKFADTFLEAWRRIATAMKEHPALYGYDLINEPFQSLGAAIKSAEKNNEFATDYLTLQYEAAKIVRTIDNETPIIIESNNWDAPGTFAYLQPLPIKDVIYQVHMYSPFAFTHQGVRQPLAGAYPGKFDDCYWNKDMIRRELQPVIDFQKKYGAKIYVGEFSAVRWAPGAAQYLTDCIELFEEFGWDWSYHAFREWSGWSVEHSEDKNVMTPADQNTDRKKVLLKFFKNNL